MRWSSACASSTTPTRKRLPRSWRALEEADQLIARDPAGAAKIYLDATKEKYSVEEIVSMIKAPNVVYSTTPNATMVFANFMFKTGLIKTKPASWKEFFFPVAHGLPGT